MARFINITDFKGRDASVLYSNNVNNSNVLFFTTDGLSTRTLRVVKTTVNQSYSKLIAEFENHDNLAKALINGNPEIDLKQTGRFVSKTSRVFINSSRQASVSVNVIERRYSNKGEFIEEREVLDLLGNINADNALKSSGRLLPKLDAYNKFVLSRKYQISHTNGLTFDFLFEIAKELDGKKSLMPIGSGEKGLGPLVFQDGGKPYRGFLEGRIRGNGYLLILHLSNLELRSLSEV